MEWTRGEECVSTVFVADDARKLAVRSAALAAPKSGPSRVMIGCLAAPVVLVGACLTSVHHAPLANGVGYGMVILVILIVAARERGTASTPSIVPSASSVFTIVVTPTTLTQLSDGALVAEIALADIADVTSIRDEVVIVRQDASQLQLTAPAKRAREAATDLDAEIREMRALHAGGYR